MPCTSTRSTNAPLSVCLSLTHAPVPFYMSPTGKKGADEVPATVGDWEPPLDVDPYDSLSCAVKENNCGQHAGHSHGSQDRQLVLGLLIKVRQLETQRLEDQAQSKQLERDLDTQRLELETQREDQAQLERHRS